jgi:hypothetical protein
MPRRPSALLHRTAKNPEILLFLWDILLLQLHRKRMCKLGSLFLIFENKRVQIFRASDLKLDDTFWLLLDRHHFCILPPCRDEELFDISHLLRLSQKIGQTPQNKHWIPKTS